MSDNGEQEFEELLKQITHEKKLLFLENYPKYVRTSLTAQSIGVSPDTPYQWVHRDEVFSKACQLLKKRIDTDRLEEIEVELHTRAMGGTSKQSDILLMFEAKALYPDKYREKVTTAPLIGNVTIQMDIPRPWKSLPEADIVDITPTEKSTELPE